MANYLSEASMGRFYQHLMKENDCIVCISADRSDDEDNKYMFPDDPRRIRTNKLNNGYLEQQIKQYVDKQKQSGGNPCGYHRARGGFIETAKAPDGTELEQKFHVEENSFVIYHKCDDEFQEKAFKRYFVNLGVKYRQESILWVGRDKRATWVSCLKGMLGKETDLGPFRPDTISKYYTKIKGRKFDFIVEEESVLENYHPTPGERRAFDNLYRTLMESVRDERVDFAKALDGYMDWRFSAHKILSEEEYRVEMKRLKERRKRKLTCEELDAAIAEVLNSVDGYMG